MSTAIVSPQARYRRLVREEWTDDSPGAIARC